MHLKRWLTAIVAVPILIFLISEGDQWAFGIFIVVVGIIAFVEYFNMVLTPNNKTGAGIMSIVGFIAISAIILCAGCNRLYIIPHVIFFNFIILCFLSLRLYKSNNKIPDLVGKQLMGVIYISLPLSTLVMMRNSTDGINWIFTLLILVIAADTGAYYAGTYFGKHKLCPSISPGKTFEGLFGGIIAVIIFGTIAKIFLLPLFPIEFFILYFFAISIICPMGDLFESILKRAGNIKESGKILPGHGGILDRIDALLFAAPMSYFFKIYLFS